MKRIFIPIVAIALGSAGFAAAAIQYEARASAASDAVSRKLDVVGSILLDAEGRMRSDSEVASAARELLAIQIILAGQEFPAMTEDAQRRVLETVKHVERQEGLTRITDEGLQRWATITRECLTSSEVPRSCGLELPSNILTR